MPRRAAASAPSAAVDPLAVGACYFPAGDPCSAWLGGRVEMLVRPVSGGPRQPWPSSAGPCRAGPPCAPQPSTVHRLRRLFLQTHHEGDRHWGVILERHCARCARPSPALAAIGHSTIWAMFRPAALFNPPPPCAAKRRCGPSQRHRAIDKVELLPTRNRLCEARWDLMMKPPVRPGQRPADRPAAPRSASTISRSTSILLHRRVLGGRGQPRGPAPSSTSWRTGVKTFGHLPHDRAGVKATISDRPSRVQQPALPLSSRCSASRDRRAAAPPRSPGRPARIPPAGRRRGGRVTLLPWYGIGVEDHGHRPSLVADRAAVIAGTYFGGYPLVMSFFFFSAKTLGVLPVICPDLRHAARHPRRRRNDPRCLLPCLQPCRDHYRRSGRPSFGRLV